jgi:hypothetical protein
MAAVAISYVIAGPGLGITPLLSLGPAFATLTGGVRYTLSLAAVAFMLSVLLLDVEGQLGTNRALAAFLTIGGVTIAALVATTQRQRRVKEPALDRLRGDLLRYVGHPLDDDAAMLVIARLP